MSESSSGSRGNTSAEQRYASEQSVKALLQSCSPHQRALLCTLAVADRYRLEPAPMVSSLGMELPVFYQKKAERLAGQLAEGTDLDEALCQTPGLMPSSAALAIRIARQEGSLGEFYDAILSRAHDYDVPVPSENDDSFELISGLGIRAMTVALLIIFIMLKLVPEFSKMLQEFGVEHPSTLTLLMSVCNSLLKYWFVGVLFVIAMVLVSIPIFRQYLRRWNPFTWRQPGISRAANRRRTLALATQSDSSPTSSINWMLNYFPGKGVQKRLRNAQTKIENGSDVWGALASEKIISNREAQALELSSAGQTQAWLLRWSASNRQTREITRSVVWTRIFLCVANIGLGLIVVLAATGVFMTLIAIMKSLY